jgi:hypothetical protein
VENPAPVTRRLTLVRCRGEGGATRRGSFKLVGSHRTPMAMTEKRVRAQSARTVQVPCTCTAKKGLPVSLPPTVPQTDTGGLVEQTKADERTLVKELGKMIPYLRKKGCCSACTLLQRKRCGSRSEQAHATGYQNLRSLPRGNSTYRG